MSVCDRVVGFELSHCNPMVDLCLSPLAVTNDLRVVVAVWAVGGEIDGFLGIVCHLFGLSMTVCCHDFLLFLHVGPSVWLAHVVL